jgi:hypothetical protein
MVYEYKRKAAKGLWASKSVEKKKKSVWFDVKKWEVEGICTFCSQLYVFLIFIS